MKVIIETENGTMVTNADQATANRLVGVFSDLVNGDNGASRFRLTAIVGRVKVTVRDDMPPTHPGSAEPSWRR